MKNLILTSVFLCSAAYAKKALTLESPDDAYGVAAECIRTALSRRNGPVFMDVPIDVFFGAADIPEATEHLTPDPGPPPDPDRIAETARSIREAKHPVVVAGAGVFEPIIDLIPTTTSTSSAIPTWSRAATTC